MSLQYLRKAVANNDTDKLIRYVRLHLGDGNEVAGRKEIDKVWIEALKLLLDIICGALDHLANAKRSGEVLSLPVTWARAWQEAIATEQRLGLRT